MDAHIYRDFPCKSCDETNKEPLLTNASDGRRSRYLCQLTWNATFEAPQNSVQIAFNMQRSDSIPYPVQVSLLNLSSISNSDVQSFYQVHVDCMYFEAENTNIKMRAFDCYGRRINVDCFEDRVAPTTVRDQMYNPEATTVSGSSSNDPANTTTVSEEPANKLTIGLAVGVVLTVCLIITGAIFFNRKRMDANAKRNTEMSGNSAVQHSMPPAQNTGKTPWGWSDAGTLVNTAGAHQSFPEDPEESSDNWEEQLRADLPLQFVEGTTYRTVNQSICSEPQSKQNYNSPGQLVTDETVAMHRAPNHVNATPIAEYHDFNESQKANSVTLHTRNEFRPPETLRPCDQFHRHCAHQMPSEIRMKMLAFNMDD